MSDTKSKIIFTQPYFKVLIQFSEDEARALHGLTDYGGDKFVDKFKEYFGSQYTQKHEKGLVSFFERLRSELPSHFAKLEKAREAYNEFNKDI